MVINKFLGQGVKRLEIDTFLLLTEIMHHTFIAYGSPQSTEQIASLLTLRDQLWRLKDNSVPIAIQFLASLLRVPTRGPIHASYVCVWTFVH